jgi:Cdc6-like AAA superfamily ATPase
MSPRPLCGRADEVDRTRAALRRTLRTGKGQSSSISGEAGIGKTANLDAIAEQAQGMGFAVGTSKAEELDQVAQMTPLLVALRSRPAPLLSRDDFAKLATLCWRQLWLVDRLTSLLEKRVMRFPVLLAVDDIHRADHLSVFALRIIPRHLASFPFVWIFTTRPGPATWWLRSSATLPSR